MSTVEEIQSAIEILPPEDFARLREWFSEKNWEQWDEQIAEDAVSGKLEFLAQEALSEKEQGQLKDL